MPTFLTNIDLSKNQLQNATLHPTGTAPATPATGQIYFDTSAAPQKGLWYYDGAVWAPVRVQGGVGVDLGGTAAAPVYDIDFTATSLSPVTTNESADIFAMYDDSVSGHRSITFGNLESNLTIANMIGGGTVGTVKSVTAGNGMTQTGGTSPDPVLNVVSHAGTANTVGTLVITADSVGVALGTTNITAAPGNHTHLLAAGATDVTATVTEVNLLDLSAQTVTAGEVLIGTGASTAAWSTIATSDLSNSANIVLNNQVNTYTVGKQTFIPSTTSTASIRLQSGVDPTTPVQGDIWLQGSNLKYRDASTIRTLIYSGGAFHDGFSDYVADEHVGHSNISIVVNETTNETSVTGGSQTIDGNVTFTIGIADNPIIPGTGGMVPTAGTTAQRVVRTGNFRYNTSLDVIEWYNGTGWVQPDTGGGEANVNSFQVVTGDTGTATADNTADTLAITTGTGLVTLGVSGAAAGLTINHDIANITNTATATGDVILLGDVNASSGIIKRDAASFITDQGIAKLASPVLTGNPTAPTPSPGDNDTSIATTAFVKAAVDAASSGMDVKDSVRVATDAALPTVTASGGGIGKTLTASAVGVLTVDGAATVLGDRILVKNQAAGADNGIYEVTTEGTVGAAFILTRATDADTSTKVTSGMFTFVEEGTANANAGWLLTTDDPITIDTTALSFAQFSGAGQIDAGDGLTKTGNTLDVNPGTGIAIGGVGSDQVIIDTTWEGQTAITTVGELGAGGSIGAGFTAIIDARLATISTANKVSGSAVQLSTNTAIQNSTGLNLKTNIAGTGLSLDSSAGNQILNVAVSDVSTQGIVELATVAETEAKTDTERAVTPAGLASFARKSTGNIGNAADTVIDYTHNLGTNDVLVQLWSNTTDDMVFADVDRNDADSDIITITFASAPASNDIRVVVIG